MRIDPLFPAASDPTTHDRRSLSAVVYTADTRLVPALLRATRPGGAPRTRSVAAGMIATLALLTSCQNAPQEASEPPPATLSEAQSALSPDGSDGSDGSDGTTVSAAKDPAPWWPEQVDLSPLRHTTRSNPYGDDFDYVAAFEALDLAAVKRDIEVVLTDSQDWWPADYGNYGPLFIRMAWHSAGTYRATDGRGGASGGQQRFEPLNSWPDNANLDKARRLLWPVKKKYGRSISWADLMVLTGNVAMESMGFETLGFAGGRVDDWEAERVDWGPEDEMLASQRFHGDRQLDEPLAAARMGLIYVNPEGPDGNPDPRAAGHDIRTTFARMAMNDEETVALIAGGHTFGKAHGAHPPADCVGAEPAAGSVHAQGMGWHNKCGTGRGADTVTSGLEGAWTAAPVKWTHMYFSFLFKWDWELTQSPAGAKQWTPAHGKGQGLVPDAHDPSKRHAPMMLTTDLALREDPAYAAISERFKENPEQFEAAFARAWFKLTHRDMGPRSRYLGSEVPEETFAWQDPLPERVDALVNASDIARLKEEILASSLTPSELIRVAWASASTFRGTDMRGGANGARVRLAPQKDWEVNDADEIAKVVAEMKKIQEVFNEGSPQRKISLADLIVLGGSVAIEQAARGAGRTVEVSFAPGRVDASQAQTDTTSFAYLEPKADGFRNFRSDRAVARPADALIDKAATLGLTVPEMTALVGGLRVLGANAGGSRHGVFTSRPGQLSNDFFVHLLDLSTTWTPAGADHFEGRGADGQRVWTATEVDLVFGSNAELRAVCEVYAYDDAKFVDDFVAAWVKVMRADRFDLQA